MRQQRQKKRNRHTKKKGQRIHAKRRAHKRYGLLLTNKELAEIVSIIQSKKATLVRKSTNRITIFELMWRDNKLKVAYDTIRHSIASFLPLRAS